MLQWYFEFNDFQKVLDGSNLLHFQGLRVKGPPPSAQNSSSLIREKPGQFDINFQLQYGN